MNNQVYLVPLQEEDVLELPLRQLVPIVEMSFFQLPEGGLPVQDIISNERNLFNLFIIINRFEMSSHYITY